MPFQTPITVERALERIQRQEYVLPAIQREFEWSTDQITRLFDSLMRGYPIGAFLFWTVKPRERTDDDQAASRDFVFYGFIRNYHELKAPHCPRLDVPSDREVTAILDGQQRLTALNIGLRGSHAEKLPRRWARKLDAYPEKRLYLNLAAPAAENELGMEYDFRFLTEEQTADDGTHWFRVADSLRFEDAPAVFDKIQEMGLSGSKFAFHSLDRLRRMAREDGVVSYYEEEGQDLDKVLNIFIRVNSGGTVLSYSDLLLSIATAQWSERDARDAIHGLVDDVNAPPQNFGFTQDLILKAGLVITDIGDIRFKVTNFNRTNMQTLEAKWDDVAFAIRLAARLLSEFGFSSENLTAASPLVPIAYYLHRRGATDSYLSSVADRPDREAIRSWVIRSLVKPGIWGSGLDTLLAALRNAIRNTKVPGFPVAAIEQEMSKGGKSLAFSEEEIQDLVDTPYGKRRVFPLLSLLYPGVNVRGQFHEDHVFPKSLFTRRRLIAAATPEDEIDSYLSRVNGLPNLQLLDGPVNVQKQAALPLDWAKGAFPTEVERTAYLAFHDLEPLPDLSGFIAFYERRRDLMANRLRGILLPDGLSNPDTERPPVTPAPPSESKSVASTADDVTPVVAGSVGADVRPVQETARESDLAAAFHEAMVDIYRRAKSQAGYTATYFLSMISDRGGYETAKYLISTERPSDGYTALYERGRLDLTVEALVLRTEWNPLFSDEERALARRRLTDYGFDVDTHLHGMPAR